MRAEALAHFPFPDPSGALRLREGWNGEHDRRGHLNHTPLRYLQPDLFITVSLEIAFVHTVTHTLTHVHVHEVHICTDTHC